MSWTRRAWRTLLVLLMIMLVAASQASQIRAAEVDTVPPTIADIWPAHNTWITWPRPLITVRATDNVGGSGIDPSSIVTMVDGAQVAHYYFDSSVHWGSPEPLADGDHTASIELSDVAGNRLPRVSWVFKVDTVYPTLSLTRPIDWATSTKPDVVITAVEEGSGIDEASTVFTLTGSESGLIAGSGCWNGLAYTFTPASNLNEVETYTVNMNVRDNAGRAAFTLQRTFRVDVTAPVIDGGSWSIAEGSWINTPSALLDVNVSDQGGSGVSVWSSQVTMTGPGSREHTSFDPLEGKITISLVGLGEGPHTVTLNISDYAGNLAVPKSVTFNVDFVRPIEPSVSVPYALNDTTPTFTWSGASDASPGGGIADYFVQIWKGGDPAKTVGPYTVKHSRDPHSWELPDAFASDGTDDGVYIIDVWSRDAAGNYSLNCGRNGFLLDTQAPSEPTVIEGPSITNGRPFRLSWSGASDNSAGSGIGSYIVEVWKVGGTSAFEGPYPVTHTYGPQNFSLWQPFASDGSDDGPYEARVWACDIAGNPSRSYASCTFDVDMTPPPVPDAPKTQSPTRESIQWWVWDSVGSGFVYYDLLVDDMTFESVGENGYYTSLGEGLHFLQVRSVDEAQNASDWSAKGYVEVDQTPPDVPSMNALPSFIRDNSVSFNWLPPVDAVKCDFAYSKDGGVTWVTVPDPAGQSYIVNIADVPDGTGVVGMARAHDAAGNVSEWSTIVQTTVDRTGPVAAVVDPAADITTNAATFAYRWTAVDAGCGVGSYKMRFNGHEYVTANTTWTGTLVPGINTFEVRGIDALGNEGEAVAAPQVTQVVPQISIDQPAPGGSYKINEVSTIAFKAVGHYDGAIEVRVNGVLLDSWRLIELVDTPGFARFYILLDAQVMAEGAMGVAIKVGTASGLFMYDVDAQRSGFGFGRLRPW